MAPSYEQLVGAGRGRVAARPRVRQHRASVVARAVGGDARTALQRGLDHDGDLREPGDDPVAHRERVLTRLRAVRQLAHDQAGRAHPVEQGAVATGVHDVEPGRDHADHRAARVEGALVDRAVDADGQAR